MTLVGLDLDATRARAVHGPASPTAAVLRLGETHAELPLAVNLQGRQPRVGAAALALCRRLPDCACVDFLAHLGSPRTWVWSRHRLDAARALGLIFDHLGRALGKSQGVALSLPAYLSAEQAALVGQLAGQARWRLLGTVPAPLAAVRAAHVYLPWSGVALVLDVDGHALTWSAVAVGGDSAQLLVSQAAPQLARGAWLGRLLAGVAQRCVRQSRRDPCESAEAEQSLYDQLGQLLEAPPPDDQPAELVLQCAEWYQRVSLSFADLTVLCQPLVRQTLAALAALLESTAGHGPVGAVLLTAAAARLPGLAPALEATLLEPKAEIAAEEEDFGEGLLQEDGPAGRLQVLAADDVARSAHELAAAVHRGELPAGSFEAVPLPSSRSSDNPDPPLPPTDPTDSPPLRLRLPPRTHLPSVPRRRAQPFED